MCYNIKRGVVAQTFLYTVELLGFQILMTPDIITKIHIISVGAVLLHF